MSDYQPSILVVDDSSHFRRYLRNTFAQASWSVLEWDPKDHELDFIERLGCENLTAAIADWHLGIGMFSGLEALLAIRAKQSRTACILYSIQARGEEWRLASEDARRNGIVALEPGSVTPKFLYDRVIEEVKRQGFQEPRAAEDEEVDWIRPEPDPPDLRLEQAIESVGRRQLISIIQGLFPERGPHNPIRFTFLSPGFSGARVFLLKDPLGTVRPGPRYILKVAYGDEGYRAIQKERVCFHRIILGDTPQQERLRGYVAEELRPSLTEADPVGTNDWFGIAYREVGNGVGWVTSFRDLYLQVPESGKERQHLRRLADFLKLLYSECLGHWWQHGAKSANRRMWAEGIGPDACYGFHPKKKHEIFAALDELGPRARNLLDDLCGVGATDRFIFEVTAFIEQGRCSRRISEPTLFHREFQVLEAGTHGDLHAGNILAVDRHGDIDLFVIDFSEYQENGHPFYDYARLENDIRMRLMNYEDGSDILDERLHVWLAWEESLQSLLDDSRPPVEEPLVSPGRAGFTEKGYWLIGIIRWLAYQNLSSRLKNQGIRPPREIFSAQYISAVLHRTLISLASTDIVTEKKILGLWLSARLIACLGTVTGRIRA